MSVMLASMKIRLGTLLFSRVGHTHASLGFALNRSEARFAASLFFHSAVLPLRPDLWALDGDFPVPGHSR